MKWSIICDSSCDILSLEHLSPDTDFSIAPLKILVGGEEFVDDEGLNRNAMLVSMANFKGASSTACPSPFEWTSRFEAADYSIAICISSELSGTYNSALTAKNLTLEKFGEKRIYVLNSKATSGTMVLLAQKANALIGCGLSFDEVINELEQYNNTMQLTFCLSTYGNLIKSGRMSAFSGAMASILGIRAVAKKSPKGEIQVISKQRGDANTYKFMANQMAELKNLKACKVIISHCQNAQGAHKLKNALKELHNCVDVHIIETRGLCSYYAGVGGIIVSY
ncbi:MAG: DegV family protein [Oscillospiraceae bacterium]